MNTGDIYIVLLKKSKDLKTHLKNTYAILSLPKNTRVKIGRLNFGKDSTKELSMEPSPGMVL